MGRKNTGKRNLLFGIGSLAVVYGLMSIIAKKTTESEDVDEGNPYLESDINGAVAGNICNVKKMGLKNSSVYEKIVKPSIDKALAFGGLILLSPLYAVIALIIYIDDPGKIFFTQKRVGKNKHFFMLHKFRSMKTDTPHDVPTHLLKNPDQYITKIGTFLRKTSLDELPQIWDIFRGKMSVIGPRPALWNQNDLIREREKYNANSIKPGLTGLAQIKGRDELEIPDKAKLDGKYRKRLQIGGLKAFTQDVQCFLGTLKAVVKHEGIVEGGTGNKSNLAYSGTEPYDAGFEDYGCYKFFNIDTDVKKRVLITGAHSFIGEAFEQWLKKHYPNIEAFTLDMRDDSWNKTDFSCYDTVFHVAGIAHVDIEKVDKELEDKYYSVNTELAIKTAEMAKKAGVKQFIFMSSMIVYGDSAPYGKEKIINEQTVPLPANCYGDSKLQGEIGIRKLASSKFHVAILRPPMIYGSGAKGNYSKLVKIARRLPVFPDVKNRRSMLYIDNLCEFVSLLLLSGEGGIYFPQNKEYTEISSMVKRIGDVALCPVRITKLLNPAVWVAAHIPGKTKRMINKAFGSCIYDQKLSTYRGLNYQIMALNETIEFTEKG